MRRRCIAPRRSELFGIVLVLRVCRYDFTERHLCRRELAGVWTRRDEETQSHRAIPAANFSALSLNSAASSCGSRCDTSSLRKAAHTCTT